MIRLPLASVMVLIPDRPEATQPETSRVRLPSHWNLSVSHLRSGDRRRGRQDDHRAVLRSDVVEIVDRPEATGARHIANDHVRLAGDIAADMAGQEAAPQIRAAAGCIADDDTEVFTLIEICDAVGGGRLCYRERSDDRDPGSGRNCSHVRKLLLLETQNTAHMPRVKRQGIAFRFPTKRPPNVHLINNGH